LRSDDYKAVSVALGCTTATLYKYEKSSKALQKVKEIATARRGNHSTLQNYIFGRLTPEAQRIWEKIQFFKKDTSSVRISAILDGQAKRLRQELFIHALISNNFDISEACRLVGVTHRSLQAWKENDLEFRELVEEIQIHKKNFFESKLMGLVEQGHPGATIFVNRTVNADRGYSEKMHVQHSGNIQHTHGIDFEQLDLDVDTKMKIYEAIQKKKAKDMGQVIDVEPKMLPAPSDS
jgi:hypothetical protein